LPEENKLGVMPISKLIWNMSLPIIASMLVQALYNIVDSVFVSRVSEQALTAVSLAFPAQNLMIGLATGTAVGVNALMGRALGAGQRERADKVANHGILLALVGFVISAALGATCSDLFFRSQTQIENIIRMGNDYLRVVTIGSLGMFCQIMYERLLQGTGRSILSMYTQGLGAIINIILDPIFIFTLNMGVTGAAVARDRFGVPLEIENAIRWHTTGKPDMTTLEKVLYMADYIEPSRDFDGVDELRRLAYTDLDAAMVLGLKMSLEDLKAGGITPHENTVQALNWYQGREKEYEKTTE